MEDIIFFLELPTELKLLIWGFVIPEARIIDVMWNKSRDKYYTDTEQPAMLRACNEFRQEVLKFFEVLEIKMQPTLGGAGYKRTRRHMRRYRLHSGTYIDWTRDTIYLSTNHMDEKRCYPHFMMGLAGNEMAGAKLQDLTLTRQMHFAAFLSAGFIESLSYLKKLRKIGFVLKDQCCCDTHGRFQGGRSSVDSPDCLALIEESYCKIDCQNVVWLQNRARFARLYG